MRPICWPEQWELPEGARLIIIGGENNTEPAEYVLQPDRDYNVAVSTVVQLDPAEVEQIAESGMLILTLYGAELPWRITPAPPIE